MATAKDRDDSVTAIPAGKTTGDTSATSYEGVVRRSLMILGSNMPDALLHASGEFWKHCQRLSVAPQVCAAVIYGSEKHQHEVARTVIKEAKEGLMEASEASEAPTSSEWEVVVRSGKGASVAAIQKAAGRKATKSTTDRVFFGGFYDDEVIREFAAKLTKEGFMVTYGPKEIEKADVDVLAAEGDPSAMEMPRGDGGVQSQIAAKKDEAEACTTCIPWQKVSRDPAKHEKVSEFAKTFGEIKTSLDVYRLVGDDLNRETSEVFLVIPLDIHSRLAAAPYEVARGQRDRVAVGLDNVMDAASDARCAAFLCVHNHPSGSPKPSDADIELTRDIRRATPPGRVFVDHLIITPGCVYSCVSGRLHKMKAAKK